jgi:hypothetical protein
VVVKSNTKIAIFSSVIRVSGSERLKSVDVNLVEEDGKNELTDHFIPVFEKGRIHLFDEEVVLFKKFLQKRVATFANPDRQVWENIILF